MKKSNLKVKFNRRNLEKIAIGAFCVFSLSFFAFSVTNNMSNKKVTEIETEKPAILVENNETQVLFLEHVEKVLVGSQSFFEREQNTTTETTTTEEVTTNVETTVVEEETTTENVQEEITTENVQEETTEETIEEQIIEETVENTEEYTDYVDNYSSTDEYIYYLISQYSGYTTRIELTYDNVLLLGQLVYSEAGDEPYEGQIAVGEVIINRLYSNPNYYSIHDVIFKPGQFSVVSNGTIYNTPSNEAILAAVHAILGEAPTGGAIYFDDPRICSSWASKNRPYGPRIGNHQFYY